MSQAPARRGVRAAPPPEPATPPPVVVTPAPAGPRVFGGRYQAAVLGLTGVVFVAGVVLLWLFGFTFWALLEALVQAADLPRGRSWFAPLLSLMTGQNAVTAGEGWPLDAGVTLATLATWAFLYLAFDALSMYGNLKARERLRERAVGATGGGPLPPACFVELRATEERRVGLTADVGWILLYPDRFVFLGDAVMATMARGAVVGGPHLKHSFGRLGASWVTLDLPAPYGQLRFLGRDTATRLSDTAEDAEALYAALRAWVGPHPPSPSPGVAGAGGV